MSIFRPNLPVATPSVRSGRKHWWWQIKALCVKEWLLAGLLILVLAALGYGHLLRTGEILYSPYSDVIAYHLETKAVLFQALQDHKGIPFWRSDQFSGYPALTNPQALYTYPLHFLFYLLPPEEAMEWTLWLHFVVAAAALYLVGLSLGLDSTARLMMAISALFSFKLQMAAYAGWLAPMAGIALFPLLYAATFHVLERPGVRALVAVSAAGGLCLHTGQLQFVYNAILFLGAYVLARAIDWARRGEWLTVLRTASCLCFGTVLSLGLAAYLLMPLAADLPFTSRYRAGYSFFITNGGSARDLLTFLAPEILGTPLNGSYPGVELWETVGYFGLIQLVLAVAGATLGRRRPYAVFLSTAFWVSLVLTVDNPLLRIAHAVVPGFSFFRSAPRFLFLTAFFGTALAGIGFQEIVSLLRTRGRQPWMAPAFGIVVLLLISAEGIHYARRYLHTAPATVVFPAAAYHDQLALDRSVFRVAPLGKTTINYGAASRAGLQLVTGYDSFNLAWYQSLVDLAESRKIKAGPPRGWTDLTEISRPDLLDVLNVKYVLSTEQQPPYPERFEQIGRWQNQGVFIFYHGMDREDVYLYRNKYCLPRAFWVEKVTEASNDVEMLEETERQLLRDSAIVLTGRRGSTSQLAGPEDRAAVIEASDGFLRVSTTSQEQRFLVLSEVWHAGWQAYIDGVPRRPYRTDLTLMGLWVPGGKHEVVLQFRPVHWRLSVALSAACFAMVVFLAVWQTRSLLLRWL